MRTDRLHQEYGVELRFTAFPLHPETPEEGMELSKLFAGREELFEAMQTKLAYVAAIEGIPLTKRTRTYNSRLAQELGKLAESQGVGDPFHRAVYRAFFVDGINIALIDELLIIAESVGIQAVEARAALLTRGFAAAVDADWQRSRDMRISAVPTHLYKVKRFAGFGTYDDFVSLIGVGKR